MRSSIELRGDGPTCHPGRVLGQKGVGAVDTCGHYRCFQDFSNAANAKALKVFIEASATIVKNPKYPYKNIRTMRLER
ncbi:hypothetical protein ACVIJ6_004196 [Bradyrhizobium sp. USDA 4369]